jgi:hypothetical protein
MGTVSWTTFVGALPVDTIGGSEKIPTLDTTAKHITPNLLATYVNTQQAAATVQTPATGDELHGDRSGAQSVFTLDAVSDYAIARGWTQAADGAPVTNADELLIDRAGTKFQIDVDDLATYVNSAVLDLTALSAATPGSSDLLLFGSGATPKKITLANLETQLWTDFGTYVAALSAVSTSVTGDVFYCIQSGTVKKVTLGTMKTFLDLNDGDVTGPTTPTATKVPQWNGSGKLLDDGLQVVTSVRTVAGGASDTALATEQAVREAIGGITELDIDGATDIGAALADADLFIVDDGAAGVNRKMAASRIWTYVVTNIQGLTNKAVPVNDDILTIQDSADANNLKELTLANLSTFVGGLTNLDIDGATDIGAALADGDLLIVDDGATGTNRKSAVSRIWDYIVTKIQGMVTKSVPVDADILMIQDSANANVPTELTVGNLWDNRYAADMLAVTDLSMAAWVLDEDNMASNSASKVPSQQSVKAYVDAVGGTTNNFAATSNPGVTDDIDGGYTVGSVWVNVATDAAWICADNTDGAAVWQSLTAAAAGWDGDIADVSFTTGSDIGADIASTDRLIVGDASDSNNPKRVEVTRIKKYANSVEVATYSGSQVLTDAECRGGIVYVTGAATITLPAVADGMSVSIHTIGAIAVSVDPNASDKIWLDGTALDDGDKITNKSTSGDIAVLTYYSADGWHATTNGWTDGGA